MCKISLRENVQNFDSSIVYSINFIAPVHEYFDHFTYFNCYSDPPKYVLIINVNNYFIQAYHLPYQQNLLMVMYYFYGMVTLHRIMIFKSQGTKHPLLGIDKL